MVFTTGSALLDAVVLSVVSIEGTYGYKITQDVREVMDVSESTLYPVLRRLQKENYLETYDMEFQGRNRRYYKITPNGMILLDNYRREWISYKSGVDKILLGIEKKGENEDD
jgi:PadR family transcriptional regulator PadR